MGKRMAALALAVCMALPLFGCGGKLKAQSLTEGITARTIDTHTDLTGDSTAVMDFAAALLRQTAESEGVLLSPVSVLYALGMTANGASGDTLTQLEQAMGMDLTALNDYLYTYRMSLPENTKKCKLSLSNSLWLRDIFRVDDAFLDTCANYYGAEAYRSAFDDSLVTDLNRWVDNKTDGMISSLLDQPPTDRTMLYLVNAVCFDAKWREPYEKSDIADYVAGLTGGKLHALLNEHRYGTVEAAIPRFTASSSLELSDALKAMGVTDAFDASHADLRAMGSAPNDQLYVSAVLHKTYLSLDENGTKAAAVTAVVADTASAEPPEVHRVVLDRPFVYMIVDTHANLPLFLGTVTQMNG